MQDTKETKKQLIQELVALRQRLAACEAFHRNTSRQQTCPESEAHFAGDIGSCIDITERKQMEEALREVVIHNTWYGIAPEHLPHILTRSIRPASRRRHRPWVQPHVRDYYRARQHGRHREPGRPRHHRHLALARGPAAGGAPMHSVRKRAIKPSL